MTIWTSFVFIAFTLLIVYPFGKVVTRFLQINMSVWEDLLISSNIGIVIITISGFLFGVFGLINFFRFSSFIPLVVLIFLEFRNLRYTVISKAIKKNISKIDFIFLSILILTTLIQSMINIKSGDLIGGNLRLIGAHGQDSLWHLSLINNLESSIPPENPLYAGQTVTSYHYLFHLFVSLTQEITQISALLLYFKYITFYLLLLFGSTIFLLTKKLTNNNFFGYFSLIFVTLSSNLYYLVPLIYHNAYLSPSVFWIDEYSTRMVNMQLLISYVLFLTIVILLGYFRRSTSLKFSLIVALLTGGLIGFKPYATILFLPTLILIFLIIRRFEYLILLVLTTIFSAFFYEIILRSSGSLAILDPLWFIRSMYETNDHLNYPTWELQRQFYLSKNNYLHIILLYSKGLAVYLFGNFGFKLLGLSSIKKYKSIFFSDSKDDVFYNSTIIVLTFIAIFGITLPLLFIVKGIAWNSIQFSYYSVLTLSILLCLALKKLFGKKKRIGILAMVILVLTSIPGVYFYTNQYYISENQPLVSKDIVEASNFLSDQPVGTVLLSPDFYSNSLIPALSKHSAFFADEPTLSVQLIDYSLRKKSIDSLFSKDSVRFDKEFFKKNNLVYIFLPSAIHIKNEYGKKIYENNEIKIYKLI